jgi:hypothetical protein
MTTVDVGAADMASFSHYQQYGQHSGNIWHSELCDADGTNKHR